MSSKIKIKWIVLETVYFRRALRVSKLEKMKNNKIDRRVLTWIKSVQTMDGVLKLTVEWISPEIRKSERPRNN